MKTVLFSGIAAAGLCCAAHSAAASDSWPAGTMAGNMVDNMTSAADAVPTGNRGTVPDYRADMNWDYGPDRTGDYREPEYGPSIRPDAAAYAWNDNGKVSFVAPDGSSYSYDGEWSGEYVDPQGRVFEGEWQGRVTRHDGVEAPGYPAPRHSGAPYPEPRSDTGARTGHQDHYQVPRGYENYERCLKSNGVAGGAIGAILGGIAGNAIAGRGDRLGGALLGAGLAGLAGVAIEKATAKCQPHAPRYPEQSRPPYPPPTPYPPQQHPGYQGWQGGYYHYPQAPMVSVTIVPGAVYSSTTVTEQVYYETIRTYPRKKAVRKWKPKPKPRCTCG